MMKLPHAHAALAVALSTLLLAACGTPPKPPPAPPSGLAELMERPGERALFEGIRAYDDGQYTLAETALRKALAAGLQSGRDRASAHKLLAFITCTSDRLAECEAGLSRRACGRPRLCAEPLRSGPPAVGPGLPQAGVAQRALSARKRGAPKVRRHNLQRCPSQKPPRPRPYALRGVRAGQTPTPRGKALCASAVSLTEPSGHAAFRPQ
jgi:hypothetical protein